MFASAISRRKCQNSPDSFCYICGSFTILSQRAYISAYVRQAYFAEFKVKLGNQDKSWIPHKVCKQCVTSGYSKKNKCKIEYPSLPSAICPVPHPTEIPVPLFVGLPSFEEQEKGEETCDSNDEEFEIKDDSVRKGFDQNELNDLALDLGLSKKVSELLSSNTA